MTIGEDRGRIFFQHKEVDFQKSNEKMLAHQQLPVRLEYLQPHITSSEIKASPLALLAATCSSIGKTDNEKKEMKSTQSVLNKLREENEGKKSFKPYKFDIKSTILRSSPPTLTSNISLQSKSSSVIASIFDSRLQTTMSVSESSRVRCMPDMLNRDMREHYPISIKCHESPSLPHLPSKLPMASSHQHHGECVKCKPVRPHTDPLPLRPSANGASCLCPTCSHTRSELKCHYLPPPPPPGSLTSLYLPYKGHHSQPPCRDPTCTNCSKVTLPHSNLQNFLHPALIHQCTHGGGAQRKGLIPPPPPTPHHVGGFDPYARVATPATKPYVCNWVSDGKHCGNSFSTSEDLFQHLRSHTSLQQSNCDTYKTGPPQTVLSHQIASTENCVIPGCHCGQRKPSPRPTIPSYSYGGGNSTLRFTPYSRATPHSYMIPSPHPNHF